MSKSALKNFLSFFLPFTICWLLIHAAVRITQSYFNTAKRTVGHLLGMDVVIGDLTFSPFGEIQMKDVHFRRDAQIFSIKAMALRCSTSGLLHRKLILEKVFIDQARIQGWQEGISIFSKNSLINSVGALSRKRLGSFEILIDNAVFDFYDTRIDFLAPGETDTVKSLALDFRIDPREGRLKVSGRADLKKSTMLDARVLRLYALSSVDFVLEVMPVENDLFVNQAKVSAGPYAIAASGVLRDFLKNPFFDISFHSDPVRLNVIPALKPMHPAGGDAGFMGTLTGTADDLMLQGEMVIPSAELLMEKETLEINRFSSKFSYSFKDKVFNLKELAGIFDRRLKIVVAGRLINTFSPAIDIRGEFISLGAPGSGKDLAVSATRGNRNFILKGNIAGGVFSGNAQLRDPVAEDREYVCVLRGLVIRPRASTASRQDISVSADSLEFAERKKIKDGQVLQSLGFKDINVQAAMIGKWILIKKATMAGYGGQVLIKGKTHFHQGVQDYSLTMDFDKLDFKDRKLFYPVYCEISGLFSGHFTFENKKGNHVSGVVVADRFRLAKLDPLDRVADFIGINSIKRIADAQIAIEFNLLPENSMIKRFDLDGQGIRIRSDFNINEKKWLDGEIALGLPRKTLEESKIFKKLLGMARERHDLLDFVVRVNGYLQSLRTELAESDFRDTLKETVSVSVQRYIEQEADKAIENKAGPL